MWQNHGGAETNLQTSRRQWELNEEHKFTEERGEKVMFQAKERPVQMPWGMINHGPF